MALARDKDRPLVGWGTDFDRPHSGGFEAIGTEGTHQSDDAEAGAEGLLRVRPTLQDELAQWGGGRTDRSGRARMRSMVQSA